MQDPAVEATRLISLLDLTMVLGLVFRHQPTIGVTNSIVLPSDKLLSKCSVVLVTTSDKGLDARFDFHPWDRIMNPNTQAG